MRKLEKKVPLKNMRVTLLIIKHFLGKRYFMAENFCIRITLYTFVKGIKSINCLKATKREIDYINLFVGNSLYH